MANSEWAVPFTLSTPQGDLDLNAGSGDRYVLVPSKCSMGLSSLRVEADDVPQGDGGIIHRSFRGHYVIRLGLQLWVGDDVSSSVPACNCDRKRMLDTLRRHLNALVEPAVADADAGLTRLLWEPSDCSSLDDRRMVNRVKLLSGLEDGAVTDDGTGAVECSMSFLSQYPYAMDATETSTEIDPATTVNNPGTTEFFPVFKVYGTGGLGFAFTLFNLTTGLQIGYDSSFPGAIEIPDGQYAEIDTFRNTVYLNGSGANLKPGIDAIATDYWTLAPGENEITCDLPTTMLWQAAWV